MPRTVAVRLVGDSYFADPQDLARLRELAQRLEKSKAELLREATRDLLYKYEEATVEEGS